MSYFSPGKILKTFITQKGKQGITRYPKWEDLDEMVRFINALSQEDIYITFSGETITKEGEMYYLAEVFKGMEREDSLYIACFIGGTMAGSCTINRDLLSRKRSYHVGIFGITIAKEFRGEGIGLEMATIAIKEARTRIPGLLTLILNVYSPNTPALDLYKKLGFKEAGRIPKTVWYKGEYIDEIKMYKHLHNL